MRTGTGPRTVTAVAAAGLALACALTGNMAAAHAAPAVTTKTTSTKACPLTDSERAGATFWMTAQPDALDVYPGTLYATPGKPVEVETLSGHFGVQPLGTLTVATKRSPRTVVHFCANHDGSMKVIFPSDTITGPATITMKPRDKRPDTRDVFRKQFRVVVLDRMPAKPVSPNDIRAEVHPDGIVFSWTSASAQPELEHYRFHCLLPTVEGPRPQLLMPWSHVELTAWYGTQIPLMILSNNPAGVTRLDTWWEYDPAQRTVTRIS